MKKYVHLDMKGGPPRLEYLLSLLPLFRDWGGTGLLVEWEDMFPWSGSLSSLARPGHYTTAMVEQLLAQAHILGLDVIPLIQTFGHMEFVLKHDQFKQLRDIARYPNCVRPLCVDTDSREVENLLSEMIDQLVSCHPNLTTIHIGCDEVWTLGQSTDTVEYMEKMGASITDVFLDHTTKVVRMVKQRVAGVKVMVWDDMMRQASVEQLTNYDVGDLVEPVVWNYGSVLEFPAGMFQRYQTVWGAGAVWAGTAWRGATGSSMCVTTAQHHVDNHLAWMELLTEHPLAVSGFILTGWARYDHYSTLCELLPVSLPSLKCCLSALNNKAWTKDVHNSVSASLVLTEPLMMSPLSSSREPDAPQYPGGGLYPSMIKYARLSSHYTSIMNSSHIATWLNPWQLQRGFINPLQTQHILKELSDLYTNLQQLKLHFESDMTKLLHDFTAEEWINTNITPKLLDVEKILTPAMKAFQESL